MSQLRKSLWLIGFAMLTVCTANAQEEFTSNQIKQYKKGIFEVVTKKLEDNLVYRDEFPHDLIPFHLRNDKYHSVGTAFLIDDNTFVSAAHVFNIGQVSLWSDNFAVRDTKGNIFEITEVQKYSNYRDLIQFTVKGDTDNYFQFPIAEEYEEGDVVYTAGNAHGEGVIFRKGTLTSFTYERIGGKWKNIRFSAAASPGNSGGPLLNINGEVVGIVTQKSSSENLNYALPIEELLSFSSTEAEFYETQMAEVEATKTHRYAWELAVPLPKPINALRRVAEKSLGARFTDGRVEFEDKYAKDIFPFHNSVKKYLMNQANGDAFAIIDINGNGEWLLYEPENSRVVKIANNQSLIFASSKRMLGTYQFVLDKPENISLADFVVDHRGILDTFLVSMQWNRKVANTEVYILSYGDPVFTELHMDKYGRAWQMAIWKDQYSDRGIMTYCLPIPQGVACDLIEASTAWLEVVKNGYKDNLHRMMLSYSSKVSDWEAFLALDEGLIPRFLSDAKVFNKDDTFTLSVGQFEGSFDGLDIRGDSNLYVTVEVDPDNINELTVGNFSLQPNVNEDGMFWVSRYYDLGEEASDSYRDFWNKFTDQKAPYHSELVNEGEVNSKLVNLGAKGLSPGLTKDKKSNQGFLAGCELQSEKGIDEFNRLCDIFIFGLK